MIDVAAIMLRYEALRPVLDERGRRRFAAVEALTAGWGGIVAVSLFSFISRDWRGRPLTDYRTIVELIAATTSTAGLTVRWQLDENLDPPGIKVSD